MQNKEEIIKVGSKESILVRLGGFVVSKIEDNIMEPVDGEPTKGFKRFMGIVTIAASVSIVSAGLYIFSDNTQETDGQAIIIGLTPEVEG